MGVSGAPAGVGWVGGVSSTGGCRAAPRRHAATASSGLSHTVLQRNPNPGPVTTLPRAGHMRPTPSPQPAPPQLSPQPSPPRWHPPPLTLLQATTPAATTHRPQWQTYRRRPHIAAVVREELGHLRQQPRAVVPRQLKHRRLHPLHVVGLVCSGGGGRQAAGGECRRKETQPEIGSSSRHIAT